MYNINLLWKQNKVKINHYQNTQLVKESDKGELHHQIY